MANEELMKTQFLHFGRAYASLDNLMSYAASIGAADLHLQTGWVPKVRRGSPLVSLEYNGEKGEEITATHMTHVLRALLTDEQYSRLQEQKRIDLAYENTGSRFRINAAPNMADSGFDLTFRVVPHRIPEYSTLGLPADLPDRILKKPAGLYLFTGPTGSGKTTTMASLIQMYLRQNQARVITLEDPIEFIYRRNGQTWPDNHGTVTQRELHPDILSLEDGVKMTLRQDPDLILVGEIRDRETASGALTAAETGHLVFSTLHTQDAASTLFRLLGLFRGGSEGYFASQIADVLGGVVSLRLLPSAEDPYKVVPAYDILFATPAIRSNIREGNTSKIRNAIQTGKSHGMVSMNNRIDDLLKDKKITEETALVYGLEGETPEKEAQRRAALDHRELDPKK